MVSDHRTYARLLTIAAPLLLISCSPSAETPQREDETTNQAFELPKLPLTPAPMSRAELLIAVAKAASAAALGQDDATEQRELDGKKFEVRIRFGCQTDASVDAADGAFRVNYDVEGRTLRVRATPDIQISGPPGAQSSEQTIEAVEGFWVRRPWMLSAGCAAQPPVPDSDATSGKPATDGVEKEQITTQSRAAPDAAANSPVLSRTVGIAQFFTKADPRTVRRNGRAYEVTKVLQSDEQPSAQGYNLVLVGRLRRLPERKVIQCNLHGRDTAPECVVSVAFDRVWVEDPATKSVMAEWS